MSSSEQPKSSRSSSAASPSPAESEATPAAVDLEQLAALIDAGELAFPEDLPPAQAAELTAQVRAMRHRRLLKCVARSIAAEIIRQTARSSK